jgi:iron complex transport system substrate-binding protein
MIAFKFQISNLRFSTAEWSVPALILCLIFVGCSKKSEPITDQPDSAGTESKQMRIISLAPNLTEILFELGLNEQIIGVTRHCTWPPEAKEKACVGTFWQPDIEAMLALRPTLMVNLRIDQQAALDSRMERAGCKVLTLQIETIEQLYQGIAEIGQAVGKESAAQAMIQRLKDKQAAITARYVGRPNPKVLWVIQRYPLRVAGRQTFINELIEIAGGVNVTGPTLTQYPPVNTEEVIGCMPDVIIEPVMDPEQFQQQQSSADEFYHRYAIVPAVKNGRVHIVDGDVVSRLGPRLDEAAELIAACLWQDEPKP